MSLGPLKVTLEAGLYSGQKFGCVGQVANGQGSGTSKPGETPDTFRRKTDFRVQGVFFAEVRTVSWKFGNPASEGVFQGSYFSPPPP
jgi:hypothetical protein